MTLGELVPALRNASSDKEVRRLTELLEEWRAGAETAEELRESVERFIGNSWIASDEEHKLVYRLWSQFRDECIAGRLGMTINERLYCFNLLDAWDSAKTEDDRAAVRFKVDFPSPAGQARRA
jgi:hypothetical protein